MFTKQQIEHQIKNMPNQDFRLVVHLTLCLLFLRRAERCREEDELANARRNIDAAKAHLEAAGHRLEQLN